MNFCEEREVPLDFFSSHIYSEYPRTKLETELLTQIMPPSYYKESLDRLKQKINVPAFRKLELLITEWNFSLYDRNLLHDTMFMGPFVIHQAMNTLGLAHALAFWSFTDVFEESVVPSSPFYGGFGLISRDGLKKPSYYAFELLQKLGDELLGIGKGYVVTRSQNGSIQLLFYHYVHVDQLFASGDWSELSSLNRYDVFEKKGNRVFNVSLDQLSGSYKCTRYQLDQKHGSVFDEWVCMGAPESLTDEEKMYLHGRSGPDIETEIVHGDSWQCEIILPPHGVMMITLERQY